MEIRCGGKKHSLKQEKILQEAKNKKEEYEALEKKILNLRLEELRNKSNSNNKEILNLELQLVKMKSEVDEKMYKAAQVVGLFK